MLGKLAVMVPEQHGWRLKIDPDNDFLDLHPDYVDKFDEYWAKNKAEYVIEGERVER